MYELRILNGYHRGAILPLQDGAFVIGADEDSDVVLADPGIENQHARLTLQGDGWTLQSIDGAVRSAGSNAAVESLQLQCEEFARAGAIWLTVSAQHSAWQDPPPEPVDVLEQELGDPVAEAAENEVTPASGEIPVEAQVGGDEAQNAVPETSAELAPAFAPATPGRKGSRMVLIPIAAVAVLSAVAAFALTARSPAVDEKIAAEEREQARRMVALSPKRLSQDELRAVFRKRLAEVDLLSRVNLRLDERAWTVQAALNEDDAERLQRVLRTFINTYRIDFPVNVTIGNAESMLPFRIQQVISGSNASIVTDDGRRLYVGDEYRGVRLAAIEGNQLIFTGKRTLNVVW